MGKDSKIEWTDAFLVEFFEKMGTKKQEAIKMLVAFCAFRNKRRNKQ